MKKVFSDFLLNDSDASSSDLQRNSSAFDILDALLKLNLIEHKKPSNESDINLNNAIFEYVKWLLNGMKISESRLSSSESDSSSHSKVYLNSLQRVNELNSPVKIMNELLFRYSHYKLQKFFEDEACRRLFRYFLNEEKENFIQQFDESKKSKLIESIEDFERNLESFE